MRESQRLSKRLPQVQAKLMQWRVTLFLVAVLMNVTAPLGAADLSGQNLVRLPAGQLQAGVQSTGLATVDGDTIVLSLGRQVRLVGIQAPKLPLGRPGFKAWPLADMARETLRKLTYGQSLTLYYGGR
ncbi:MAG: hypothetical protein CBB86_03520 [Candidatus Endolissoclinum sp. TMED26]|nr:MAG: hypothetical protein CBB86_03520 [Candidatus Endolissoclinum sp. TMED26]